MGRRQTGSEMGRCALLIILLMGLVSCGMVYLCLSMVFKPSNSNSSAVPASHVSENGGEEEKNGECCRGIENLELWGVAVKWGADFKVNSSEDCCFACKKMCREEGGPCLCDSWVFCGNREICGQKFGECRLKRQKDIMEPEEADTGNRPMWTSGIIFGKYKGIIVGLDMECGTPRIELFPDCAPHSVNYILDLLSLHHCAGCHIYRAEPQNSHWDSEGNHVENCKSQCH